jgi:hypothetical protein
MPKNIRVQKSSIDDVISTFTQLPSKAPSDYSLREAIGQILPAIKDLMNKGYNLDEISKLLAQKNIAISSTTLKQYIRDFDKSQPEPSKPSKQSKQSKVTPLPVAAVGESQETPPLKAAKKSTAKDKEVTVDRVASTEVPYKSPPKAGSEQFK